MSSVNHIIIIYKRSNIKKGPDHLRASVLKISVLSALERDVTYTPSWSKLRPEVSQYNAKIKYHSIISLYIKQKWKLLTHILCVLPGRRVWTITVPMDLDLIYRSTS